MTNALRRWAGVMALAVPLVLNAARAGSQPMHGAARPGGMSGALGHASAFAVVNLAQLAAHPAPRWAPPLTAAAPAPGERPRVSPAPSATAAGISASAPVTASGNSPTPTVSFQALPDGQSIDGAPPVSIIPPDTHGAVGRDYVLTSLNSHVRVQNRGGGVSLTVTLNQFWAAVNGGTGAFDPKTVYDPYNDRWIMTACDDARGAGSGLLIGVSATADPTGNWFLYKIDADGADIAWADYPSIGFSKSWITVQVNMFNRSNNAYNRSHVYAFDKAEAYAGAPAASHTLFELVSPEGFVLAPAVTHDAGLDTHYLLQSYDNFSGTYKLYGITGTVGSEALVEIALIETGEPWSWGAPANLAPQAVLATKIATNDDRMQSLVYRNGALWAAHTVFWPVDAPTWSAVQWLQLSPAGAILQSGRIEDPLGQMHYAFPSLAVNRNGDVLVGYARFSPAEFASGYYAVRCSADPPGTLRAEAVLKAGEGPYWKTFSGASNRWGDYSATMVDPLDDESFWTIQEYAATPVSGGLSNGNGRWGTWWGHVQAGCPGPLQARAWLPIAPRR